MFDVILLGLWVVGLACLGWNAAAMVAGKKPPFFVMLASPLTFWALQMKAWFYFVPEPIMFYDREMDMMVNETYYVYIVTAATTFFLFGWLYEHAYPKGMKRYPPLPPSPPMSPEMTEVVKLAKSDMNQQRNDVAVARLEAFDRGPHRDEAKKSPAFKRLLTAAREAVAATNTTVEETPHRNNPPGKDGHPVIPLEPDKD